MEPIKHYIFLISIFFTMYINAQTHVFNGNGGDNDWFNAANWDVGTVPGAASNVLIPNGFEVEVITNIATANSIDLSDASSLTLSNDLQFSGLWNIPAGSNVYWTSGTISGGGVIENHSTFVMNTFDFKMVSNITLNNYGMISIEQTNQNKASNGVVIYNKPTGIIEIDSVGSWIQEDTGNILNNQGIIRKIQTSSGFSTFYLIFDINNTGIIHADEDQTFLILGTSITLNNMETGVISGSGIFDITANFTNNGTYLPGGENLTGTMDVVNNFIFGSNATLKIDIAGANPGEYDVVEITGSPTLEGTIELNLMAELSIGNELTILTTTNNSTCNLPDFIAAEFEGNSYTFEVNCNPNSIVLRVSEITLEIPEFSSEEIEFFVQPNPVTDTFQVILNASEEIINSPEDLSLVIYSIQGQKVKTISNFSEENNNFQLGQLTTGLYFLQLQTNNTILATTKMAVQ